MINLNRERYIELARCSRMLYLDNNEHCESKDLNKTKAAAKQLFDEDVLIDKTFNLNDECFATIDFIKVLKDKEIEIYCVKNAFNIEDSFREDMAYQNFVLTELNYEVKDVYLVLLNSFYERNGEMDPAGLFKVLNMTECAKSKYKSTDERIEMYKKTVLKGEPAYERIGSRCHKPFLCPFFDHCTKGLPKPNVFDVKYLPVQDAYSFYLKHIISFDDLHNCDNLEPVHKIQIEYELQNKETVINIETLKGFFKNKPYKIILPMIKSEPVDLLDHSWPYAKILYGFILDNVSFESLQEDPRKEVIEELIKETEGSFLLTYDAKPFKACLKDLASYSFENEAALRDIMDHVMDLKELFMDRDVYDRKMHGSYELDDVYKALCDNAADTQSAKLKELAAFLEGRI